MCRPRQERRTPHGELAEPLWLIFLAIKHFFRARVTKEAVQGQACLPAQPAGREGWGMGSLG